MSWYCWIWQQRYLNVKSLNLKNSLCVPQYVLVLHRACVYVRMCVCVRVCASMPPWQLGMTFLQDNRAEVSEAHDDIQRDGRAQVISIQTQVPDVTEQALYNNRHSFCVPIYFLATCATKVPVSVVEE